MLQDTDRDVLAAAADLADGESDVTVRAVIDRLPAMADDAVREAVRRLASEGFVHLTSPSGFGTEFDTDELGDDTEVEVTADGRDWLADDSA
jgi:alkylation response protein AidB-like acyl-CoA dehydrogenase